MRHTKTRLEHVREVIDLYCQAHGTDEYNVNEVAAWGEVRGDLPVSRKDRRRFNCELLCQAGRDDKRIDRFGRAYRVRYCADFEVEVREETEDGEETVRLVQHTLWFHIDKATDEQMTRALDKMATGIKKDIASFFACLDAYNERRAERGLPLHQPRLPFSRPHVDYSEAGE